MIVELSVVLDLRAVEPILTGNVERLLELIGELTPRFELLLIDEGRIEARTELLTALCQTFPQMRLLVARNSVSLEPRQFAIESAKGEVILFLDDLEAVGTRQLRHLWQRKLDLPLTASRAPVEVSTSSGWLEQLLAWGRQLRKATPTNGMTPRHSIVEQQPGERAGLNQFVLEYRQDSSHSIPTLPTGMSFVQHLRNLAASDPAQTAARPYISEKGKGK